MKKHHKTKIRFSFLDAKPEIDAIVGYYVDDIKVIDITTIETVNCSGEKFCISTLLDFAYFKAQLELQVIAELAIKSSTEI